MFKAISLVKKADGKSRVEFAKYWLEDFAPVAAKLPGLLRYTINVTSAESQAREWHGFTELWFESRAAYDAAFAKSPLNAQLDRMRPVFISEYAMYFVDEMTVVGESSQ